MGNRRRLTRGRLQPFACGHKGWGVTCHRCAQANQIEVRANELAQILKTKGTEFPEYVRIIKENGTRVSIRGGGRVWTAELQGKKTQESVLSELIHQARTYATSLKMRSGEAVKKFIN